MPDGCTKEGGIFSPSALQTRFLGFALRNPIISASSEVNLDKDLVISIIKAGVGGVVLKTWTSEQAFKIRVRPYQFPLGRINEAYKASGSFLSLSAPDIRSVEEYLSQLPQVVEICKGNGVLLIASFYERPKQIGKWVENARRLKDAGIDIIELNFSSPSAVSEFRANLRLAGVIIRSILDQVDVKVGVKISPDMEPLEQLVEDWEKAGIAYIAAHNAFSGIVVDTEKEEPFGAPCISGYAMGRAFLPISLARIVRIRRVTDLPIIGIGGVFSGSDALQYLLIGCELVGVSSAVFVEGRKVISHILDEISEWMSCKGYRSLADFKGKAFRLVESTSEVKSREQFPFAVPPLTPFIPKVKKDLCIRCYKCLDTCIYGVFEEADNGDVKVNDANCYSCGFCVGICPNGAIVLVQRKATDTVVWSGRGTAETFKQKERR